ncbi:Aste57867_15280 [Aphanomyces stellatus]|uniref:Aste57867_15280 protein n=1 Tax=Aphanomyces stellatus TaxID=120398 RepID=A0A485L2T1_9STRA|nr:hypothetical protein As57867_015224 [Aphanomyces stellatus]VFT92089.1 Aste57867_15280 [Aphanomyces stellatus]
MMPFMRRGVPKRTSIGSVWSGPILPSQLASPLRPTSTSCQRVLLLRTQTDCDIMATDDAPPPPPSAAASITTLVPAPKLKTLQWRLGNPISWSTLQSLVFHPLNLIMSTATFVVVLGSILSHLYLYISTTIRFASSRETTRVDITLPHCITKAAATDITVHEYFQLQRAANGDNIDDDDPDSASLISGVDLHVKHAFFHEAASVELYVAALYFVSLKPILSSLFFYCGPLAAVAALVKAFNPSPDDLHVVVDALELWTGWTFNDSIAQWIASSEHVFSALVALVISELTALVSHDVMRLVCCEWTVTYDLEALKQLVPFAMPIPPTYGTTPATPLLAA